MKYREGCESGYGNNFKTLLTLGLFFLPLVLSGCRPGYILHAGAGQIKLLYNSVEIEEALQGDKLSTGQKERLRLVETIKSFGEAKLGLKETENYQKVYLESRQHPVYIVSACPKDRFRKKTWWFPVVGDMPYLGYFNLEKARSQKTLLSDNDLDVFVGSADAYSTLGWFKDPVTLNLLEDTENSLVETILHEMTHVTLYLKGRSEFNEGLAVMTGLYGALDFFRENYSDAHPFTVEARKAIDDEILFSFFIDRLLDSLEKLYGSSLEYDEKIRQREEIYQQAMEKFELIEAEFKTNRFKNFKKKEINNAFLMTAGLYHRNFNFFREILACYNHSIKDTLPFLKSIAENQADPVRTMCEWLERERSLSMGS